MLDFLRIASRPTKRGVIEIYPKFIIKKSEDLMIRGGDFYAIWIESKKIWSTDEQDALMEIDRALDEFAEANKDSFEGSIHILHMWDAESGMIDVWHKYCQKQLRDSYHILDEKLVFANDIITKKDYSSKRLSYPLVKGSHECFDKLMRTLYSDEERTKLEWSIGAIINGDSKHIQKFVVLYGSAGTGKSTVLNIIQMLFDGYYSVFDAKALGSSNNSFALEPFKANPLVAIQHDGDLSRIEDNTRLNSLVSHELMTVNEKFKSTYANRFKCFLFMGTNKPVKITDAKSGLIRRLIDVKPTGNKLSVTEYTKLMAGIKFELGAIAYYCKDVYESNKHLYDDYIPLAMLGASNDFYNFVYDSYLVFDSDNYTTLKSAWDMYLNYCNDAKVAYPFSQRVFKEELKNYFKDFELRHTMTDGTRVRNYYHGFNRNKFSSETKTEKNNSDFGWIDLSNQKSIFDETFSNCPAQYANLYETPTKKWESVKTSLKYIDTSILHYVKVPENHIVIDFDIKDKDGNKNLELNLKEANKWPKTYAEVSKSGKGVHLHYNYIGDATKLSKIYDEDIEIKVFSGNSSLRRKLTKCNAIDISDISSGLPLKKDSKMLKKDSIKTEKGLRNLIKRILNKEIHPNTKPSVDFLYKVLEDCYNGQVSYNVSDLQNSIIAFAAMSSNQADYCLNLVNKMHFQSDEDSVNIPDETYDYNSSEIVFFDVEVFPNLFLINWKVENSDNVVRMINPTPEEVDKLLERKLVGFNCRRYDNHMLYARAKEHYTNKQLYNLSQRIVTGDRNAFFVEAFNISYTDIYDFSSKKQSLKKFEIELGIHHHELGLPWDQPVPEDKWIEVAEYCDDDVIATEAVFHSRKDDWIARQILADIANMPVNSTTNSLTTRIVFGTNKHPQDTFNYRDMGDENTVVQYNTVFDIGAHGFIDDVFAQFDELNRPVYPGYEYKLGKSTYRGESVGEGGYVWSNPGMYTDVVLLDIASMHPNSICDEMLFGDVYTKNYKNILDARIAIKHKDFDTAKELLGDRIASKYLSDTENASKLAQALKIAINSVYGLTAAKFDNPFRDPRNLDNIVAKRGSLFMVNLKNIVQKLGYTVVHIKTDSIKIANADSDIIKFVMDYGEKYGYTFEHEATYDKLTIVNESTYIAHGSYGDDEGRWTATGAQFAVPYVFKKLFSKEPITFDDMCETKSVSTALYLDFNETLPEDEHNYVFVGRVGLFTPVKPGCGGGILVRESISKATGDISYNSANGAKGYRWLESERAKCLDESCIDKSYYECLVNDAYDDIGKLGDVEWFIN